MKNLLIVGALFTLSTAAHAAGPLYCETNILHDPRQPTTTFTLRNSPNGVTLMTVQTSKANFRTAPQTFPVAVQTRGPEIVEYYNTQADFELSVNYQPINGQIRGTFAGELMGRRVQTPVLCYMPVFWKN